MITVADARPTTKTPAFRRLGSSLRHARSGRPPGLRPGESSASASLVTCGRVPIVGRRGRRERTLSSILFRQASVCHGATRTAKLSRMRRPRVFTGRAFERGAIRERGVLAEHPGEARRTGGFARVEVADERVLEGRRLAFHFAWLFAFGRKRSIFGLVPE